LYIYTQYDIDKVEIVQMVGNKWEIFSRGGNSPGRGVQSVDKYE